MSRVKVNGSVVIENQTDHSFGKVKNFQYVQDVLVHLGYLSLPLFVFEFIYINWILSIIIILPTIIDGLTQAYYNRESTNYIRVFSGFLAGLGCMSIIHIIGFQIGYFILDIIR